MKVREAAIRIKRFEAEEKAQKVDALEQMILEFEQMAMDLERQVIAEEERTGVRDSSHFAYSTFARSAAQRRTNLLNSIEDLRAKHAAAIVERDEAVAELDQVDAVKQRDDGRTRPTQVDAEAVLANS
jgi:flagellar FliJ protein